MTGVFLFQVFVFFLYIYYVVSKYGVLSSISSSYYASGEKRSFQIFCFLIGIPMVFYSHPLFMLSAFSLVVVGIADDYTRETSRAVMSTHFIGAGLGIVSALTALGVEYLILFIIGTIPLIPVKNKIWWIEIWAFIVIMTGLFIKFVI